MSRSYKKTPCCGTYKDKTAQKAANKKMRKKAIPMTEEEADEEFQNNSYRKNSPSWAIQDYKSVGLTFEEFCKEAWDEWERYENAFSFGLPRPNEEALRDEYEKTYKRK